ncbi:MAG: hypothetical protein GTO63_23485, partial [Anaerolineae bacterium]|nr:hypothetical protein [Anaerolineae bacterium]NIO70593.1 hypothetical protein [Anaerolineae bacterium]
MAGRTNEARCNQAIESSAGANIHDMLTSLDFAQTEGVASPREGFDCARRERVNPGIGISQHFRQGPPGVEMEAFLRVAGDLGVFLANLTAQGFNVNVGG